MTVKTNTTLLCSDCGINPRHASTSGRAFRYCKDCLSARYHAHQTTSDQPAPSTVGVRQRDDGLYEASWQKSPTDHIVVVVGPTHGEAAAKLQEALQRREQLGLCIDCGTAERGISISGSVYARCWECERNRQRQKDAGKVATTAVAVREPAAPTIQSRPKPRSVAIERQDDRTSRPTHHEQPNLVHGLLARAVMLADEAREAIEADQVGSLAIDLRLGKTTMSFSVRSSEE